MDHIFGITQCASVAVIDHNIPKTLPGNANVIELRLDYWKENTPERLYKKLQRLVAGWEKQTALVPIIGTLRIASQYGCWKDSEEQRLACYAQIIPCVAMIDVEITATIAPEVAKLARRHNKHLILSHHGNYQNGFIEEFYDRAKELGAHYYKYACPTNSLLELNNLTKAAITAQANTKINTPKPVLMGMGTEGPITRLLMPWLGSALVYAYSGKRALVAGQISINLLNDCLRYFLITPTLEVHNLLRGLVHLYNSNEYQSKLTWDDIEHYVRSYVQ